MTQERVGKGIESVFSIASQAKVTLPVHTDGANKHTHKDGSGQVEQEALKPTSFVFPLKPAVCPCT